jgi:hypothetical protein
VTDFRTNPKRIFAAHELTGLVDGSTATKMTVQVRCPSVSLCARACVLKELPRVYLGART